MKIYLAAPYAEMGRMLEWERELHSRGHKCTSQWVHGAEAIVGKSLAECAQMDLDDVDQAEALVLMSYSRGTLFTGGGRHVEFGYGLARDKLVIVVNPMASDLENVFHHLPQVVVCGSLQEAADYIGNCEAYR